MENSDQLSDEQLKELAERGRRIRDDSFRALAQALSMLTGSLALTLAVTEVQEGEDGQQQGVTHHFSVCNYGNDIMIEHQGAAAEMLYDEQQKLIASVREEQDRLRREAAEKLPMPGEDDGSPA